MSWYGKYEDDGPSLEDRIKKLEKDKRRRELEDNSSMTTFMGGAHPAEDADDDD
jgi:hypothetical protein